MLRLIVTAAVLLLAQAPALAQSRMLEIRSYNLKPGSRDAFHQLALRESLPMLARHNIDVVAYGPSRHDQDSYFLMRAFDTVEGRQRAEDAFYGSEDWLKGPRETILSYIISYTTVVLTVDGDTLSGLRRSMNMQTTAASDLDTLNALNEDYINSVQRSDVKRFEEILAGDFLCTQSDGTLLNRHQFLEHTAKPVTISNLAAHDVNVRLMGDVAIVHARTTYTLPDGRAGEGRYTDIWARRDGRWLAVAAHVTRK
jgi:ketosteroid isomerase-like protein